MSDNTETNDTPTAEGSGVDKAKQAAVEAKDKATEVAKKAGEKMPPQVKETYGKVSEKAGDAAKKATPKVKETYGKLSAKVKGMVKSDDTPGPIDAPTTISGPAAADRANPTTPPSDDATS